MLRRQSRRTRVAPAHQPPPQTTKIYSQGRARARRPERAIMSSKQEPIALLALRAGHCFQEWSNITRSHHWHSLVNRGPSAVTPQDWPALDAFLLRRQRHGSTSTSVNDPRHAINRSSDFARRLEPLRWCTEPKVSLASGAWGSASRSIGRRHRSETRSVLELNRFRQSTPAP